MKAAIYYQPEAYSTSGPKLMGRNAAGESFLRGFLSSSRANEFWVHAEQMEHAQEFAAAAIAAGRAESVKVVQKTTLGALAEPGTLYFPGPNVAKLAWQRASYGHNAWSLCGVTHTTSSAVAMDAIAELITAPVQPWDAVICTSMAVKSTVVKVLQAQAEYCAERMGAQRVVLPQLPIIPLGIHPQDFVFSESQKQSARQALGADDQTLVVLYVGRLAFHAKAHPLAMYQALEKAAAGLSDGQKVVLVECGWHANNAVAQAYADAAQMACPNVRVVTLDGRKADEREIAWAGADIFCSLSDNVQETFGITPIEAMAAGLPVVVTDWDGYRDTVRDGVDGFRVPTLMPSAGLGGDLALRHALDIDNYDMYCGLTCSLVAVDIDAVAQAFSNLFKSDALRQQMSEAGRQRARDVYDWKVIIPQYEVLWAQMAEIRKANAGEVKKTPPSWPARLDPFDMFDSYPTAILTGDTIFRLAQPNPKEVLARWSSLTMINFAKQIMPSEEECNYVFAQLANGPTSANFIIHGLPTERQAHVYRALVWLTKLGILSRA